MKYLGIILLFTILFSLVGYVCASAIESGNATKETAYNLSQQFVTKILQNDALVTYDTHITANPKVTYEYADNTDAFVQQMVALNITMVYVTGNTDQGYNFRGYTNDWSFAIHAYSARPLVWKWVGF